MKTTKIFLSLALLWLIRAQFVQWAFDTGQDLCFLQNLPHRGLGLIYTAHIAAPWREDIEKTYLCQYLFAVKEDRLIEGKRLPAMTLEAVKAARDFPHDADFQKIKDYAKQGKE